MEPLGLRWRGYYYRERTRIRAAATPRPLFSPAYIYNQLVRTPDCQGGSKLRDALELMRTEGVATLADFPYDDRSCVRRPSGDVKRKAAENTIGGYRSFGQASQIRADDVKGALLAGDPVAIGMNIDEPSLSRLKRGQIYDQDGPASFDGHAMVVTGFDDRIQAFKIMNSWGTKWADGGFGWISHALFAANTKTAFVIEDGGGVTPPTPTPAPPRPVPVPPRPETRRRRPRPCRTCRISPGRSTGSRATSSAGGWR